MRVSVEWGNRKRNKKEVRKSVWSVFLLLFRLLIPISRLVGRALLIPIILSPSLVKAYFQKRKAVRLFREELLQCDVPADLAERLAKQYSQAFRGALTITS